MQLNGTILPNNCIFGHFGPGLAGSFGTLSVGWLVVVARAVSRKTPILYLLYGRKEEIDLNENDSADYCVTKGPTSTSTFRV